MPEDLARQIPTRSQIHLFKHVEDQVLLDEAQKRDAAIRTLGDLEYRHFLPEMQRINRAFFEVMTEGDRNGQPFTFPIPTVNITEAFDWYGQNTDVLFENTARIGSFYFQNFIGSQASCRISRGEGIGGRTSSSLLPIQSRRSEKSNRKKGCLKRMNSRIL